MFNISKGGRHRTAPYGATTHHRIPEKLKPLVVLLTQEYRRAWEEGRNPEELLKRVECAIAQNPPELKAGNKYDEVRDRILADVRSDKLKAVKTALDRFISEISV